MRADSEGLYGRDQCMAELLRSSSVEITVGSIMGWIHLLIAGLTEIVWAVGLKYTQGWTKLWPSVITLIFIILSYVFLSLALKTLPLGTAYAIWTGIGAVGTAIAAMILFDESHDAARLACIGLIVAGIFGLKVLSRA